MKHISLTQGQVAVVDDEYFEALSGNLWFAKWSPGTGTFYAQHTIKVNGQSLVFHMHRVVMGLLPGDKRQIDHINHDSLDNRRANLRLASASQNQSNQRLRKDNTSGYKGVITSGKRWQARINVNGKRIHLGRFGTAEEASVAYQCAAKSQFGELASETEES